jgi:hypothetical protein
LVLASGLRPELQLEVQHSEVQQPEVQRPQAARLVPLMELCSAAPMARHPVWAVAVRPVVPAGSHRELGMCPACPSAAVAQMAWAQASALGLAELRVVQPTAAQRVRHSEPGEQGAQAEPRPEAQQALAAQRQVAMAASGARVLPPEVGVAA